MQYKRMAIEVESPEELGYSSIKFNLAESSISDRKLSDYNIHSFNDLLAYIPHRGNDALRHEIIDGSNGLNVDDVLVTAGAAMALFIVSTAILQPHDHLVIIRPNYASNIETPKGIGCEITYIDLNIFEGFQLPMQKLLDAIKPNTKLISLTCPHNPTGVVFHYDDLVNIINIAEQKGIYILMDETYRELNFKSKLLPYYATLSEHVISVGSMSKAYGVPGIRTGWLITKSKKWMEVFLAAKEQILLSNPVIDEYIALQILSNRNKYLPAIHNTIHENYKVLLDWAEANKNIFDFVLPDAGVVFFPKVKDEIPFDFNTFQQRLYQENETLVGYGHWFDMSDKYMRIGFGYPSRVELESGLGCLVGSFY